MVILYETPYSVFYVLSFIWLVSFYNIFFNAFSTYSLLLKMFYLEIISNL